jgi:hypothetical protein
MLLCDHVFQDLNVQVFGSVSLNSYTGGFNPYIVDMTLRMGGKIVWFPTISSENHIVHHRGSKFPKQEQRALPEVPIQIIDENGKLVPKAHEVLEIIAEADAVVSPGHTTPVEALAILKGAVDAGVRRMIVNHPEFMMEATEEQVLEFVRLGAYIEHSVCMYPGLYPLDHLVRWIELVGPERTLLGSDLGQKNMPLPVDGLKSSFTLLLKAGVGEDEIELMAKKNPAWLLKLED